MTSWRGTNPGPQRATLSFSPTTHINSKHTMSDEQQFHIQPHPANDNVSNTAPTETTPGLGSAPNLAHLPQHANVTAPGPQILTPEIANSLEKPKTREELAELSAKLKQ